MPPKPILDIALGATWKTASPTFLNFNSYVKDASGITISRPRNRQTGQMQGGTCSFTMLNAGGHLNPKNTKSPFYGAGIERIRGTPIRWSALYQGTTHPLFRGFVWDWTRETVGLDEHLVHVRCVDAFEYLNRRSLATAYSAQLSGARFTQALDAVAWPAAMRSVDAGVSFLQAAMTGPETALKHLQRIADSEGGTVFIDAQGRVVFQGRNYRSEGIGATVRATFGGTGGLPYQKAPMKYSLEDVYNVAFGTREGASERTVTNDASIDLYGRRELPSRMNLWIATDAELDSQLEWLVYRHSGEDAVIDQLEVVGQDEQSVFAELLGREISDRIRVIRRLPGDDHDLEYFIEDVDHRFSEQGSNWVTRWSLSPAAFWGFWILDQSILDLDTVLGV